MKWKGVRGYYQAVAKHFLENKKDYWKCQFVLRKMTTSRISNPRLLEAKMGWLTIPLRYLVKTL